MVKKELASTIRALRKSRNMTQAEFAKLLKQSPSSVTMYETGRRVPKIETLEAIADIFNVPFALLDDSKIESGIMDTKAGVLVNEDPNPSAPVSEQRARFVAMAEQFPEELIPIAVQFLKTLLETMKKEV